MKELYLTSPCVRPDTGSEMPTLQAIVLLLLVLALPMFITSSALASGATTAVRIVKYADDGATVLSERTVGYEWMEDNLPILGDGLTHYYHQGPIFEGDIWDPAETNNLKDKGAVMGTDVAQLCSMVGGIGPGEELMMRAVDGWSIRFKYSNIYEPTERQGHVVLCWYNGEDAQVGERYGEGYVGNDGYRTALQLVIMAGTTNPEGKYVFGNTDMKETFPPEEGYSHFYLGEYPSSNGLSGKWITEAIIYSTDSPPDLPVHGDSATETTNEVPWLPVGLGSAGAVLVACAIYLVVKTRSGRPSQS